MSSLAHTVQIAAALNIQLLDDDDRPLSAWIMPVVYLMLWWPGWVWRPARARWPGWVAGLRPERAACGLREAAAREGRGLWLVMVVIKVVVFS
jgi:hypothetical protein